MKPTIIIGFDEANNRPAGLDRIAYHVCQELDLPYELYPAEWDKYGKGAGMRRNEIMVDSAHFAVGFWDGTSSGTANAMYHAIVQEKFAKLYLSDGRQIEDPDQVFVDHKKKTISLFPLDPILLGPEEVHRLLTERYGWRCERGFYYRHDVVNYGVEAVVAYMESIGAEYTYAEMK